MPISEQRQQLSPPARVDRLLWEVRGDFLAAGGIAWDEDRDIETMHADFCVIALQRWILSYLKSRQKMGGTKIAAFLKVSRNAVNEWDSRTKPVPMRTQTLQKAFTKSRRRFGEHFTSREPRGDTVDLWGLMSLLEYARARWFANPDVAYAPRLEPDFMQVLMYMKKHIATNGSRRVGDAEDDFFNQVRGIPLVSKRSDAEIADMLETWLKPFLAVHSFDPSLFDEKLLVSGLQ